MTRVEAVSVKRDKRGGTYLSVKITSAVEENVMPGKALKWPCWNEGLTQKRSTEKRKIL